MAAAGAVGAAAPAGGGPRRAGGYVPLADGEGLPSVLPAALHALAAPEAVEALGLPTPTWELPPARHVVVLLVDGLGTEQLRGRSGHAPYLSRLTNVDEEARCGFPSTTATSLASLGTGLRAGQHGITGWTVALRSKKRGAPTTLLNHLGWRSAPEPHTWQPHRTLLQEAGRHGVAVTSVSAQQFEASRLTRAALRGGAFSGVDRDGRHAGVTGAIGEAGRRGRSLVYCYWPEVDKAGHVHGPDSLGWGEAVEEVDGFAARLADSLPQDAVLLVTADHGMVAAPPAARRDLALEHDALGGDGIEMLAGDPRAPQAWCVPGAAADVAAAWRETLSDFAVLTREEVVEAGWFGPVRDEVLPRIGDVVAASLGEGSVLDSRLHRAQVLGLVGHHGSVTDAETRVPLLVGQA